MKIINSIKEVEVHSDRTVEIRELEPGQWYITRRDFRKHEGEDLRHYIRMKLVDRFWASTVLGTEVHAYPSDKVHPVTVHLANARNLPGKSQEAKDEA